MPRRGPDLRGIRNTDKLSGPPNFRTANFASSLSSVSDTAPNWPCPWQEDVNPSLTATCGWSESMH